MRRLVLSALCLGLPVGAAAQAPPSCAGHITIVRDSAILPGQLALFEKAVADQGAWYASHGNATKAIVLRVMRHDPKSGLLAYADDEAMTATIHPGGGIAPPAHDAAWDAFVAEFKASSTVKTETTVCMPNL
jgi:hypothetical protein